MPDAYRAAPPRRAPHVIETLHTIHPRTLVLGWVVATIVLVAFSQRVVITCEREPGGGACSFRSEKLFWSSDPERVLIADIADAREQNHDGRRVILMTKSGIVPLESSMSRRFSDDQVAVVDAVNKFLRTPSSARVTAAYGSRWADRGAEWMMMSALVLGFSYLTRKFRVIVDHDGGVLSLDRPRFPWGRSVETLPLETVSRAVVEDPPGSDTSMLALIRSDGTVVPVTRNYDAGRDRAVDQINAALADRG